MRVLFAESPGRPEISSLAHLPSVKDGRLFPPAAGQASAPGFGFQRRARRQTSSPCVRRPVSAMSVQRAERPGAASRMYPMHIMVQPAEVQQPWLASVWATEVASRSRYRQSGESRAAKFTHSAPSTFSEEPQRFLASGRSCTFKGKIAVRRSDTKRGLSYSSILTTGVSRDERFRHDTSSYEKLLAAHSRVHLE